jgi:hypothetical protein
MLSWARALPARATTTARATTKSPDGAPTADASPAAGDAETSAGAGATTAREPRTLRGMATPVNLAIVLLAALALALRMYQLTRPGYMFSVTEYDDGPYFGSAVRLVNGAIPYRDFLLVQPPGITILMIPAALFSKAVGTGWGLATGRLLTVACGTACVIVGGMLVRHRGVLAVLITGGLIAVYPDSIQAAHTVLVEPWLALLCLLGALAIFDRDRLTSSRARLIWGGAAFGFGGAVEVWAIFPVIVVAILALLTPRRLIQFLVGVTLGFLVPVVPFVLLSPHGFYRGLVTAQVGSRAHFHREANWFRMSEMSGLSNVHVAHQTAWLVAVGIVAGIAVLFIAATIVTRRLPTPLELFAVGSTILTVAAFMWPNQFHYHFVAFLVPSLAMCIGLPAARLFGNAGSTVTGDLDSRDAPDPEPTPAGHRPGERPGVRVLLGWAGAVVASVVLVVFAVLQFQAIAPITPHVKYSTIVQGRNAIPPGACVIGDEISFLLTADRFVSNVPDCPLLVDSIGTDYALSHGLQPSTGAAKVKALTDVWKVNLERAQYVWLSGREGHRVPWTPQLRSYLRTHFTRIIPGGGISGVYRRDGLSPGQ